MSEALQRAHEALAAKRAAGESTGPVHPAVKARENPKSRRLAITAMCCACMGSREGDPVPRRDIRECTSPGCALYVLRPYQGRRAE